MTGGAHRGRSSTVIDLHLKRLFHGDLVALLAKSAVPPLDASTLGGGHLLMVLIRVGGRIHYDGKPPEKAIPRGRARS
jgi:hypothetical protein